MPDLLLELRSEEIPARMQRKAAGDLKKLVTDALVEAGLSYEGAREYWTPRRLTLDLRGLTARSADVREERKGPRTDAPEKAIEGFLRGAGLASISEATVQTDPKKGEFYVAIISKPGRPAEEIIANYYLRRLVRIGDQVTLANTEGTVDRFAALGLVLKDSEGCEHFVPARHVLDGLQRTQSALLVRPSK